MSAPDPYVGYATQPPLDPGRDPDRRPRTVTAAAVVTIVCSALTALALAAVVLYLLGARDDLLARVRDQPGFEDYDSDQLFTLIMVIVVAFLVWSVLAVGLAVLALRRSNVARILLVVSAVGAALMSLIGILSVVSAATLIGAIAAIVLLFTGGANDWYARRAPGAAVPPSAPTALQ